MIDRDEFAAWVRLLETPGVGRTSARRLLTVFGSPQAVFDASSSVRREAISAPQAAALATLPDEVAQRIQQALAWLAEGSSFGRTVLPLGDPRYPKPLLHSSDPPLLLYAEGSLTWLRDDALAVVGSRNPTPQGLENARKLSAHLSHAGLTIVSGLALGIDGAAHRGGLEGGGSTIAVVGTGLDRVYPKGHQALAQRIAAYGLMLSEYSPGTPPLPANFPTRNRIIAGLTRGTLVVEAALHSGSLITARMALENGGEVFAVPGSIHSPQARGCLALIKQGAKLVDCAEDVLSELRLADPGPAQTSAKGATLQRMGSQSTLLSAVDSSDRGELPAHREYALLTALGFDPVTLDELVGRTGRSAAELNVALLDLELYGHVARLPGQRFQRLVRA